MFVSKMSTIATNKKTAIVAVFYQKHSKTTDNKHQHEALVNQGL